MKKPIVLESLDNATHVGWLFGTPFVVIEKTWFPLIELFVSGVLTWITGRRHPDWSWGKRTLTGGLSMMVLLGLEWCHNLAHALAAWFIGKPMDAMRIAWGMPLVVYYKLNDETVTPRQHIWRALGGPLFNAILLPFILLFKRMTKPGTIAHEVAGTTAWMDKLLSTASFLPIPGIDGGPILKWSLVSRGQSLVQADETVKKVNLIFGMGLLVTAGAAWNKRRWFSAISSFIFAATTLAIGSGLLKEE